jgi:sulfatase modifying factor 1
VTAFRLDRYEVTVGRFRPFVAAMAAGFMPAAGAGKHVHLNLGQGLNATGGGHEPGWVASWNGNLATTTSAWNTKLAIGTWTPAPGGNERLPITGISWYDAYAFCIWDGGFLPSDAEWNYAAAGGVEQRAYPWSPAFPPGSSAISCGNAWYSGCSSATTPAGAPIPVGGLSPGGDGKWGQADLAGNVYEWVLDWSVSYVNPCNDCVNVTPVANTGKVIRGGSVTSSSFQVLTGARGAAYVAGSFPDIGVRCARAM